MGTTREQGPCLYKRFSLFSSAESVRKLGLAYCGTVCAINNPNVQLYSVTLVEYCWLVVFWMERARGKLRSRRASTKRDARVLLFGAMRSVFRKVNFCPFGLFFGFHTKCTV